MKAFKSLNVFIVSMVLLPCFSNGQAKDTISVYFEDLPLEIVLDSISIKSHYDFSYNSTIIPSGNLYTYIKQNVHVSDLLNILFVGTGLEHVKIDDQIVIKRSKEYVPPKIDKSEISLLSLTGWVREVDTKLPIEGANVYIKGSTIGTTTDRNGNYRLNNVTPGNYIVVFSHVGYQTKSHPFKGDQTQKNSLNTLMAQRVEALSEVEVVSEPYVRTIHDRKRHFETFRKELLGTSNNSFKSEIENPEVLDYTYSESTDFLHVIASKPILITNYALGYHIILDLEFFNKKENVISFHGQARYESMEPEKGKQKRAWKKARIQAYNGSMIHFFKSLVNDNLRKKGYKIWLTESLESELIPAKRDNIVTYNEDSSTWLLSFKDYLYVEYSKEIGKDIRVQKIEGLPGYYSDLLMADGQEGTIGGAQKSFIKLRNGEIEVDQNGKLEDRLSVVSFGYWSWERLGNLMPIDYDPKTDKF